MAKGYFAALVLMCSLLALSALSTPMAYEDACDPHRSSRRRPTSAAAARITTAFVGATRRRGCRSVAMGLIVRVVSVGSELMYRPTTFLMFLALFCASPHAAAAGACDLSKAQRLGDAVAKNVNVLADFTTTTCFVSKSNDGQRCDFGCISLQRVTHVPLNKQLWFGVIAASVAAETEHVD